MTTKPRSTAKPRRKRFIRDCYSEPLPARFELAIDMWIKAAVCSTYANSNERRDIARRPTKAVRRFARAVDELLSAGDDLHKALVGAFPEKLRDVWEGIRPPLVEQAPNPPQRRTGLCARLPRDREPVFSDFVEALARTAQLFRISTHPSRRQLAFDRGEWVRTLPSQSWAKWAALALQTLADLSTLDEIARNDSANRASPYRDRVIDEALRWQDEGGDKPTAARLANAIADRVKMLAYLGPSDFPARLVHVVAMRHGVNLDDEDPLASFSKQRLTAAVFGHDRVLDDEDPLASLRKSLGDRLKQRTRENRPKNARG